MLRFTAVGRFLSLYTMSWLTMVPHAYDPDIVKSYPFSTSGGQLSGRTISAVLLFQDKSRSAWQVTVSACDEPAGSCDGEAACCACDGAEGRSAADMIGPMHC